MIQVKQLIEEAQVIIITAGAGMGVDSGLPDFRGKNGFWNTYKSFQGRFTFQQCANPNFLKYFPKFFWGFYGHRLAVYRDTKPHEGFQILRNICEKKPNFVITSNVGKNSLIQDGQFQAAGFKNIYEIHGSIHRLQCTHCHVIIDSITVIPNKVQVNENTFEAAEPLPKCKCGSYYRPNILMFEDWEWISAISDEQQAQLETFIQENKFKKTVILEFGAGTAIPTIRLKGENLVQMMPNAHLIRVNPFESETPQAQKDKYYSFSLGALEFLKEASVQCEKQQI